MEGKPGMETESCLASKLSNNYFKLALLSYISIFSLLSFFLLFYFFFFLFSSFLFFARARNTTLSLPLSRNRVKHFFVEKGFTIEILFELSLIKAKTERRQITEILRESDWKHFPPNFSFPSLWFRGPIDFRISSRNRFQGISKIIYRNYTIRVMK